MHVPTAPALILGGLLAVAGLDLGILATHHGSHAASSQRPSAALLAADVALADATSTVRRPTIPAPARPAPVPVPHAVVVERPARHVTRHASTPARPRVRRAAGTTATDLAVAVRHLPGYQAGSVRWVLSTKYGNWGTADWYNGTVYVSPNVPHSKLMAVVIHEWDHMLSVQDYGGDVAAAVDAMNKLFGGTGLVGAERAADCMARLSGATWTHYTPCSSDAWRAGARLLLAGRQL